MAGQRIVVLGAGNIGGALGRKWLNAGHTVTFGVNNPAGDKANALRADLGDKATIGTTAEALAAGDIILLAIPGRAVEDLLTTYAAQIDGKLVIYATNKFGAPPPANNIAAFQAQTPKARIFRVFNTLGWENFVDPIYNGVPADQFYCGGDGDDQAIVEQLISDVGLNPVRVGDISQIEVVDGVLRLWAALAMGPGKNRNLAFKVLTR
jgi:predicted dinucleotide-binding enzyme